MPKRADLPLSERERRANARRSGWLLCAYCALASGLVALAVSGTFSPRAGDRPRLAAPALPVLTPVSGHP
jgi:hypothetical protein